MYPHDGGTVYTYRHGRQRPFSTAVFDEDAAMSVSLVPFLPPSSVQTPPTVTNSEVLLATRAGASTGHDVVNFHDNNDNLMDVLRGGSSNNEAGARGSGYNRTQRHVGTHQDPVRDRQCLSQRQPQSACLGGLKVKTNQSGPTYIGRLMLCVLLDRCDIFFLLLSY